MAYKVNNIEELLQIMRQVRGERSDTQFASTIGISKQFLSDIYNGRREPNHLVLSAIGVSKVTTYPATGDVEYLVQPPKESHYGKERKAVQAKAQRKVQSRNRKARSD